MFAARHNPPIVLNRVGLTVVHCVALVDACLVAPSLAVVCLCPPVASPSGSSVKHKRVSGQRRFVQEAAKSPLPPLPNPARGWLRFWLYIGLARRHPRPEPSTNVSTVDICLPAHSKTHSAALPNICSVHNPPSLPPQ
ncbi:hypothetical protein K431DRAFT_161625 [Polychaeton citri CBS 116435]|uniref:Secreted protein n=1 Tax=Polychaeton citri CBS 116435 TaxID=1314669 RepID=A0A9P4PY67_9PEZI|nr:hypothetical protein K431DRAFT_161625 [Polychaeton citri CBS 116435]